MTHRHILLATVLTLPALAAHARLGFTIAEAEARYGKPSSTTDTILVGKPAPVRTYDTRDYTVTETYVDGRCEQITIQKKYTPKPEATKSPVVIPSAQAAEATAKIQESIFNDDEFMAVCEVATNNKEWVGSPGNSMNTKDRQYFATQVRPADAPAFIAIKSYKYIETLNADAVFKDKDKKDSIRRKAMENL